jgi:filamentous hemagglutinin family protein
VVNWQSFNVNAGEAVKFIQPSSTAAILNRVTGGSVSNINGLVEGNGRVYLINPNGIVVGANGVVNVNGGFVASTKSLADSAFMSGGALVFTGESTGSIQILGKVQSAQGDVILIAPKIAIEKTGGLIAGQTIKLVAANEVELSNGKFTVKPKAGDAGQLTIEGALEAAKVQLAANNNNLGALAINTTGTIRATGTQTNPDGSVSIIATGEGGNIHISGNIRGEKGDGHGGAVTILADNGIRINGTINANTSAGADSSKTGGDIYIGRDITTNKLARATDVSGATLLSNKGFVETSGDWLKTHNITVLAKDWLLDPTDITIVATGTATADTRTVPGSGLFQDTTGISASEVLKSTIETAINNGTSVTISTANSTFGANGSGNITIATALSFNNTGLQDATFRLFAVNGITQNAGSTINAVGSKNVNIEMVSEGRHMGVAVSSPSSRGIVINTAINTNGTIKIDGFNRNTGGNSVGVTFNSGASINAASFDIKGSSNVSGPSSPSSHGVLINGNTSFTSSSTTVTSQINGTSLSNASGVNAGTNIIGTNIRFNAGTGSMIVKGSNANTQLGLRISPLGENTALITDGNVTLGALEPNSNFSMRAGSITANSGSLKILGSSVTNFGGETITANNGVNVYIEGKTTAGLSANAVSLNSISIKALQGSASSAGNIDIIGTSSAGISLNLTPSVIIEGANVTLKGTATNGSAASGGAINGSGKITATGAVVIEGVSANAGGYSTITNGLISATGDITIKGMGTAKHGVFLGSNVVGNNITSSGGNIIIEGDTTGAGGISGSASGTAITGNAIIKADKNVTITGKTNGFYSINGLGNITSDNGNVSIEGYSRDSRGVNYDKTITANNGDIKIIGGSGVDGTVTSMVAGAGSEHGIYFNGVAKAKNVTIDGTSIYNVGTFIGSSSGTNIDATEKATIVGSSTASTGVNLGSTNGFGAFNATIKSGGDTSVTGTGVTGVRVWAGSSIDAKNINVLGTSVTRTAGESGIGVDFERIVSTANFKSTDDINIEGTLTGVGVGSGVKTSWRNQNGNGPTMNAGGNFTLRANNRALASNTNAAINTDSGMQVTAGKNIVVQAETNNSAARAMIFYSLSDMYRGNTSFASSGGDILIQANQGAIVFNNQQASAAGQLTDITGRNITIDNTGAGMATGSGSLVGSGGTKGSTIGSGSIETTTGAIVAGAGKASADGINFADARKVEASGNLNIMGASTANWGVVNYNGLTGSVLKGGAVNIQGTSETAGGIFTAGKIESTVGAVSLIGRSTAANGASGVTLQAEVKGKANVVLEGYSANTNNVQGLVIQDAVTSETGTITVIGETKAATQRAIAITQNGTKFGSLNTTNKDITIIGNTLLIAPGTPGATVNAGTGTVFIKTLTAGNEIVLGAEDSMNTSLNSQKLGIDNTELSRITAGNLAIGDTASAGKITVAGTTSTASATGNITLQTGGNIAIDQELTVDSSKTSTFKAGGTITDNDTTGVIKASKLELLGNAAAVILDSKKHEVGTLAADVKSLIFTNGNKALTVGAVNTINSADQATGTVGIKATEDIKVTTQTGNLTVSEKIMTAAGTPTSILLNAGESLAAGTPSTGSDIQFDTNGSVVVGNGGKAQLMSGSISGTTGIAAMAASGSGKFRYNSDEATTNYTKALDTKSATNNGINVIYREKPIVALKVDDVIKLYNGLAFNGGSVSKFSGSYLGQNGDSAFAIGGNAKFSGSAQGAINVSATPYVISATETDTGKSALGYDVTYENGSLMIKYSGVNKAPTPPETYTRIAGDVVNLAPVSFAVGIAPATAAGDEADPNICYAWGQRDGGSVIVHTLLKPSYLGLRHAKTDTQEAMGNGGASSAHSANPCGHDVATNLAQSNNI